MKTMISMFVLFLSVNLFAATAPVEKSAKNVYFKDMKLSKEITSKVPYDTYCITDKRRERCTEYRYTYNNVVKVVIGYRAMGEVCRRKRGEEFCSIRMKAKSTSVYFKSEELNSDVIETLKKRKRFFPGKKKYAALAKSLFDLNLEEVENAKIISVDLK